MAIFSLRPSAGNARGFSEKEMSPHVFAQRQQTSAVNGTCFWHCVHAVEGCTKCKGGFFGAAWSTRVQVTTVGAREARLGVRWGCGRLRAGVSRCGPPESASLRLCGSLLVTPHVWMHR